MSDRFQLISQTQQELRAMVDELRTSGGGGGGGGANDRRLDRLEARFDKFTDDMSTAKQDIAVLKERVSNLPTKEFIIKALLGALAVITGLITFADKLQALVK